MSTLLEQASLVMIPSGYKEDVVYSQIPTNGNGDLSFTRASNGTRINSAGLVEVVPWNLLQQSEAIGVVSPWTNSNLTITANSVIAPNGTTTADVLTETTATTTQFRTQQTTPQSTNIYTLSVYVKNITGTRQAYIDLGPVTGFFNFATETTYSASAIASFENVGNGWYRFSLTTATAITPSTIYMGLGQSNSETYTGNGTSAIAFWGAQVNIGSTAKPYFPTTDRLNVPRLTYQNGGGGCPSLLLEKQSTNLALYSEQFDNAAWSKDTLTIGSNVTTSPDGTQNADNLIPTTSNGFHYALQSISYSAGANTISCYAKSSGYDWFVLDLGVTSAYAYFNVNTGVVGVTGSGATASIQSVGNGWYRCIVTFTLVSSSSYVLVSVRNADNGGQFVGNGTSGIYLWGVQLEASSYPTSYIPTTSASATRVADACSKTGISSLIGQTEGTLFIDMVPTDVSGYGRFMNIYNGANSSNGWNAIISSGSTPNTFRFYGNGFDFSGGACLFGVRAKAALAYKNGVLTSAYVNGASVGTLTAVTTGKSYNTLELGSGPFGTDGSCNVNQSIIFPTALTNAELASLTTL